MHTADDSISAKNLNKELLLLIMECALIEQRLDDVGLFKNDNLRVVQYAEGSWVHIVLSIAEHLHFSDAEHFYNLRM